jgi:hypothetical protein
MHDMCRYNMASQQNSTTQSIYLEGSKEPYIVRITIMGHMTQHTEHTGNGSIAMFGYRHLERKKALEPDYLQDPPKGTRS